MEGKTWVAVHVAGDVKAVDIASLQQKGEAVYPYIDLVLKKNLQMGVFLLTDSHEMVLLFKSRYGERILTLYDHATQFLIPLGQAPTMSKETGDESVIATYLAIKCDIFLGNKESNMSLAIYSLKNWAPGCFHLTGKNNIRSKNYGLHNWT